MLPDRVSNPGPLTYESGALPIALRDPAWNLVHIWTVSAHDCNVKLRIRLIEREKACLIA